MCRLNLVVEGFGGSIDTYLGKMEREIEVIRDIDCMRNWSRKKRCRGERICLVPTMGCLHRGHLSLIEEAKRRAQRVVVSIYVNPGQFAPGEDLATYPTDLQGDLFKLQSMGVDVLFNPADLYAREAPSNGNSFRDATDEGPISCLENNGGNGHETWIRVERLEKPLCGKSRPVFFRGVATVVAKLFNIVEPDVAIFGKKDYQQWRIVCRMVRDLDFDVEIIGSEIIRDSDGLALSSRNVHLSSEERQKALSINRSLNAVKESVNNGNIAAGKLRHSVEKAILDAGGKIDYVEIVDQETLQHVETIHFPVVFCVAAWFGGVRLIDNIELQPPVQ